MTERVVLAYFGDLDTSVTIAYLADQTGAEVIGVATRPAAGADGGTGA